MNQLLDLLRSGFVTRTKLRLDTVPYPAASYWRQGFMCLLVLTIFGLSGINAQEPIMLSGDYFDSVTALLTVERGLFESGDKTNDHQAID